jgi:HAD superfamily hydrolase (TIGR01509 family)
MTRAALLFDLDGTLVDTDRLHHAAFAEILAERGATLSLDDYRTHIMGHPNEAIMARFFPGEEAEHGAIAARKEAMFRASLASSVPAAAGIHALLDWAEAAGVGCAVVTNAPRANAVALLAAAGLAERLSTLVLGDELARPKPDPMPYQEAMRRLGATPSRSVAFEDSRSGLRAARAAGAHVVGVTTGLTPDELMRAGAHRVIADFNDPALWLHLDQLKDRVA